LATAFQEAMLTHAADGWTAIEEVLRNLDLVRVQVAR
jgi:hypothetical protein